MPGVGPGVGITLVLKILLLPPSPAWPHDMVGMEDAHDAATCRDHLTRRGAEAAARLYLFKPVVQNPLHPMTVHLEAAC
jgi:hypothetical protein